MLKVTRQQQNEENFVILVTKFIETCCDMVLVQ